MLLYIFARGFMVVLLFMFLFYLLGLKSYQLKEKFLFIEPNHLKLFNAPYLIAMFLILVSGILNIEKGFKYEDYCKYEPESKICSKICENNYTIRSYKFFKTDDIVCNYNIASLKEKIKMNETMINIEEGYNLSLKETIKTPTR